MTKTVFVLSGGASLGASQVGMLQALAEREVQPDLLIGTSAGALNTAFIAGHPFTPQSVEALANIWRGLSSLDVFPPDPFSLFRSLRGQTGSLCSNHALRNLISRNLTFTNLEDAPTPCQVVATNFLTGQEVTLDSGDACDAVLASAAIPGIFPPIVRDGMTLMDGGLANNTALSQAVAADADTIYILPSGFLRSQTGATHTSGGSGPGDDDPDPSETGDGHQPLRRTGEPDRDPTTLPGPRFSRQFQQGRRAHRCRLSDRLRGPRSHRATKQPGCIDRLPHPLISFRQDSACNCQTGAEARGRSTGEGAHR